MKAQIEPDEGRKAFCYDERTGVNRTEGAMVKNAAASKNGRSSAKGGQKGRLGQKNIKVFDLKDGRGKEAVNRITVKRTS